MRIHLTGASGTGTTTLGAALAAELDAVHLDADAFYWLSSDPPFQHKRAAEQRLAALHEQLQAAPRAVLSGSIVGWGTAVEDAFDLIVFLQLDAAIRVERLCQREIARLGHADPAFLERAAQYDEGPPEGRSLAKHQRWLAARRCPVLTLAGDLSVAERVARVRAALAALPVQLSRSVPADAPELIRLRRLTRENPIPAARLAELGITAESWAADVARGRLIGHVARRAGQLLGYGFGDVQTGEVVVMALLPEAEGQGLGRQLLTRVEDDLRAHGHRQRFLYCAADPAVRSHGFYRHLGWRGTGQIDAHGDERLERED
ncbi:MAG: GNAT family N-acetyltransferase [Xanthomonadales bacterium]|jgi:GNAT superfamily N-acetyltransferase|nr:GNAT family N-acetyltransferase [Xanthomonadales bacterium]